MQIKNSSFYNLTNIHKLDLTTHFFSASTAHAKETVQESSVEVIYMATDKLSAASGDPSEMLRQAKVLGQATAQLIQSIKVSYITPPLYECNLLY